MDWLDAVLVIFIAITALIGLSLGLISTLIPLIGLIIGIVVAGQYYTALAHDVFLSHSDTAYVAAFVLIIVVFLVAAAILTAFLHDLLAIIYLDWLNHLAGLVLGAILSVLLQHSWEYQPYQTRELQLYW